MFALQKYKFRHFNFKLLLYIIFLSVMGILIIRSATLSTGEESTYTKQIMGVVIGMAAMLIVSLIDYRWIVRMYLVVYAGICLLLALTRFTPLGTDAGTGAKRWIDIGPIRIQPSEFAKVAIVIVLAGFFQICEERINAIGVVALSVMLTGIPLLLVMAQPDLSTSLVIMFIFVVMIFTAKISYRWILSVLAVVTPFAAAFIFLVEKDMVPFLEKYQRNRILSFLHPQDYPDLAMQQTTSIMAIGSGGLYGKGLFNESLDSVKNGNYLMEEDTDFIFAVAGEELGFAGCCLIIAILFLVVVECLLTASRAQDTAGRLIAAGIAAQIAFQSFVNIGVATFILPNTGLPLPFISAGLSSLLSVFIGAGMVFNIGMQRKQT
ncbi:MAG: FtsW/RodA/SpoVE family cell cycle protein [Lachnospiraceae bacterium]|nr:FtsW/RodA/SpoVE family cell cycle protein [Lachnospiraceae bacterium]MDY4970288.1 FtsW/RodA/SpoVE family cell cycle protein [Lachnospiraceae bacterium]